MIDSAPCCRLSHVDLSLSADYDLTALHGMVARLLGKETSLGQSAAPFIGLVAKHLHDDESTEPVKIQVYSFYLREILGSRFPISKHIASGLHPFFRKFTSAKEFQREIAPALERALLRSPEIILQTAIVPLVQVSTLCRVNMSDYCRQRETFT